MHPSPDISICIPVRNGGELLGRALHAVTSQQTSKSYEIMALDSGSRDASIEMLAEAGARIVHIEAQDFDWGMARNHLLEACAAPLAIQLSQDAVPARADWLEFLTKPFEDSEVAAVSGASIPDPERAFRQFQWERNGFYYFTREMTKYRRRYGRGLSFANAAIRRSVWQEIGLGPQATGEDFQFQTRLMRAGKKLVFIRDAPVLHHHNYTLRGAYLRARNEGIALRELGCAYREWDLLLDLLNPRKNMQWLREVRRGTLQSPAEWLYPLLRPVAVYTGSRFARRHIWY